ncbi:MAG: peptidyl-tRNA hydrolase Pth2 [Candidatus Hodarchaeales archaeon]
MIEYKQVIILRKDLKMSKGKAAAQASHAAVAATIKVMREKRKDFDAWWRTGQRKVVLAIDSESDLIQIEKKLRRTGVVVVKIDDAGRTQLPPNTTTALGVGPYLNKAVDMITSGLKLF